MLWIWLQACIRRASSMKMGNSWGTRHSPGVRMIGMHCLESRCICVLVLVLQYGCMGVLRPMLINLYGASAVFADKGHAVEVVHCLVFDDTSIWRFADAQVAVLKYQPHQHQMNRCLTMLHGFGLELLLMVLAVTNGFSDLRRCSGFGYRMSKSR